MDEGSPVVTKMTLTTEIDRRCMYLVRARVLKQSVGVGEELTYSII